MTRIYQNVDLSSGLELRLGEQASHHLGRVLRAKVNDAIILFNGQGGEYQAIISSIDKKGVVVKVGAYHSKNIESSVEIHLAQGVARGEKMDFIIQKAVELGVKKITPLITERCNVHLTDKRIHHWRGIAESACEQSGRCQLPEIAEPITFSTLMSKKRSDLNVVLSPHVEAKLPEKVNVAIKSIAIIIGPEGGLSDQEVNEALANHFLALNIGPRVLRTETATIAVLSILQYLYGDLA